MKATLTDYFHATHWREKLSLVRAPALMEAKMARWYARHDEPAVGKFRIIQTSIQKAGERSYPAVEVVRLPSGENGLYVLERSGDGSYKIDWEIAVNYNEVNWHDFMNAPPSERRSFRVVLHRGDYFNWQFSDAEKYRCWEIRHPGESDLLLYGYVERGSEVSETLDSLYRPKGYNVILELGIPPPPRDPRQVLILGVPHESWIVDYDGADP